MGTPLTSTRISAVGALLALGVLVGVCACSTDTAPAAAPPGPVNLTITALAPAGGPRVRSPKEDACVELGRDADQTLVVVVGSETTGLIENWTLDAPFQCNGVPQCGFVLVTVDPGPGAVSVAAASTSISIPMRSLSSPTGTHTFRVELRNSNGTIPKGADGKPYAAGSVTVDVRVTCSEGGVPPGSADAAVTDGAPEAGKDGGAPTVTDGGAIDAHRSEGGGPTDAMPSDTGTPAVDAGTPKDASPHTDAHPSDAALHD